MTHDSTPDAYSITIKNCNSIDEAVISLRPHSLNIKYGPNGTGKSTIARALTLQTEGASSLEVLTPFKYRAESNGSRPSVVGAEEIKSVLIFNESYVSQFAFQRDEVLKNSFEVFINTEEYKAGNAKIEAMFDSLKKTFLDQAEFDEALTSFIELRDAFSLTKAGAVAKTSRGFKGLSIASKLSNIPEELQGYKSFLHSNDPASWITWQAKGKSYLQLSDNCPFCSVEGVNKDTARRVSDEYESAAVKNMSQLRGVIEKLGKYFAPEAREHLEDLTSSIKEMSSDQEKFLISLREQIRTFISLLHSLRGLSFHSLRGEQDISENLVKLKIDLELLDTLNSEATRSVVCLINKELDEGIAKINEIKRYIGVQKSLVTKLIRENQDAINEFLSSSGYHYSVRMETQGDSYRMLLEHQDAPGHLESAVDHLSYGEKNAFAMVLFMHQVNREKPDLVVLDDPVSSFDKTKKFAILHQLFHGKNSLNGTTSLLLTHDIEPAIDIVKTRTSNQFSTAQPVAHFLSSRAGMITEKLITRNDISTFSEVCESNIREASDPIIKSIYLRRLFETHGNRGVEYDFLSSLLHLRDHPTKRDPSGNQVPLTAEETRRATKVVEKCIQNFSYTTLLRDIQQPLSLIEKFENTSVGYEKVQIFRILSELNPDVIEEDSAFTKFVNETYHIENEYLMQLDPRQFDSVPDFIIEKCKKLVFEVFRTS
jgi:ABC-type molybdenum transport system ATPase subunit/photorepair protein PhrA